MISGRIQLRNSNRNKTMSYKKKSWQEKLVDKKGYPKVLKLEKRFPCYNALHKMGADEGDDIVLVNPGEVIEIMDYLVFKEKTL